MQNTVPAMQIAALPASTRLPSNRAASPAALLLGLTFTMPAAQGAVWLDSLAYYRYTQPVRMELLLPVDGAGSAILNPARAVEAGKLHAQYGSRKAGDSRTFDISIGGGWKKRFCAIASFSGASGSFENTNAVIIDNRIGVQAAYRHPLDPRGEGYLSFGVAETHHYVNSLGMFKESRTTTDFGALFVPTRQPGGWRLEFGMSARDLLPFDGTVPDSRSGDGGSSARAHVDFAPWIGTGSLLAASPSRRWSLFGSAALGAEYEPMRLDEPLPGMDAGPLRGYLPRLGVRYRPIPYASLSMERVWSSFWVLDASIGTATWLRQRFDANFRLAYGPNLQYQSPDRTGWTLGWNLALGL